MRKTDKKIDKQIRVVLTDVCESALKEFIGFQWLTHLANYTNFPRSLRVVCVFDTNYNLNDFVANKSNQELGALIQEKLFDIDVNIKNIADHISYDSQENCDKNHNGKWADRLAN